MNDLQIRDLLHDVADDVEPGDRLDAIRAATSPGVRRPGRAWWVGGGAGLVAASAVAALVLSTGGAPQSGGPGPAGQPTASATTATEAPVSESPIAVYFVGDTSGGPRLYREFLPGVRPDARVLTAINAALSGDALDPDYRSPWPEGVTLRQWIPGPDVIQVVLDGAPTQRPAGMSEQNARLALEQLVRTAQALHGDGKVPVDVQVEGKVTDTILGVPTTAPLTGSPDLDVLAPVSLSDPSEGLELSRDDVVDVRGRAASDDGSVSIEVKRWEGTAVLAFAEVDLPPSEQILAPFAVQFTADTLQPGDYDVVATIRHPDGTVDSDTRRITVVD